MSGVTITLSAEALETVAERAAVLAAARLNTTESPWLTRRQAASYLGVPVSRLEKDRTVPFRRWSGRVLYNRSELDDFVRSLDNNRP